VFNGVSLPVATGTESEPSAMAGLASPSDTAANPAAAIMATVIFLMLEEQAAQTH
jgi:hypothetical protein